MQVELSSQSGDCNDTVKLSIPKSDEKPHSATMDYVFGMDTMQSDIWETSVVEMVDAFLEGYNVTIFAYGQTGAGKSFSIFGDIKTKELQLFETHRTPRS